jgi:signal transduction histidine kinase
VTLDLIGSSVINTENTTRSLRDKKTASSENGMNGLISRLYKRLKNKLQKLEPRIFATGDVELQLLLSRRIVLTFGIAAFLVLIWKIMLDGWTPATRSAAIILPPLLLIFYLATRSGSFVLALLTTNILASAAIVYFATTSRPPHVEIVYLLILPLLTSVFLSPWLTGLMGLVAVAIIALFASVMYPSMPTDMATDIMGFVALCTVFFIALGWQRHRYDMKRQRIALESQRAQLLSTLLATISHDFKTPLSIIETNLYLLARELDLNADNARISQVRKQTQRLDQMVNEVLSLARSETDTNLHLEGINARLLVQDCVEEMREPAAMHGITISVGEIANRSLIWGHEPSLRRLVLNLLQNAVNYSPDGSEVVIGVENIARDVILTVTDNGIGIPKEHLARIFEPFYRADQARSTKSGGTGLGLTIVKQIANKHGADVSVESEIGVGASFSVTFPRYDGNHT